MQTILFQEQAPLGLSIEEAADAAHVSQATIRNWIKTGYLTPIAKHLIDKGGFDRFMNEVAGKDKLVGRANKLLKDTHDHHKLSDIVHRGMNTKDWLNLAKAYENSLSNAYRNKEGIYYTPPEIILDMFEGVSFHENLTFLDPCCGSGNFILAAIKKGVKPEHVYGFDTDPNAIEITKKRILEQTGYLSDNVLRGDFLQHASLLAKESQRFDFIFTNPPWGKKIKKQDKARYARLYKSGKSLDTSSLFFFAAIPLLKTWGTLGFLVQEAFFNISTFQDTRKKVLEYEIIRLMDYDKPFKGLLTKAQAFILKHSSEKKHHGVRCEHKNPNPSSHNRYQASFSHNPKQILNFWVTQEEAKVIDRVYSLPYLTLEGRAKWALGIVTGSNEKHCQKAPQEGFVPVFKGSDITPHGLKTPTYFIPDDFSRYQQVAPLEMYRAKEKLVYKFISSRLVFYYDTKQRYVLNSANLVIPEVTLGISCRQLAWLFNSDLMNWVFQSLFRTHKILRGDLEQLPIHFDYFHHHQNLSESSLLSYLGLTRKDNGTYRIKA